MAFDSNVMKVAYTVCGHAVEKKTQTHGVGKARAFLSRRKSSGPKRVQGAYGWCPACTEYYRYDIRNVHCILKFWKFKRDYSIIGAVPQSSVCGAVLFDTLTDTRDTLDWPMPLEDMSAFLQAIEYKADPVDIQAYRKEGWSFSDAEHAARYTFAVKMRKATLEWAQTVWDQNWIRIPAGVAGIPEVHAPLLAHIPRHPKPGKEYPVLFDPFTRLPVIPESRSTRLLSPPPSVPVPHQDPKDSVKLHRERGVSTPAGSDATTIEVCFRLDYESSSPSLVKVPIDGNVDKINPERRRKAPPFLTLSSQSHSAVSPRPVPSRQSPQTAPPRASFRLAACSRHGKTAVVRDCEECKRICLDEIAIPPSSDDERECKSAPLLGSGEYIYCTQPLCFCTEVGKDECLTCLLRAKSKAEGLIWL